MTESEVAAKVVAIESRNSDSVMQASMVRGNDSMKSSTSNVISGVDVRKKNSKSGLRVWSQFR